MAEKEHTHRRVRKAIMTTLFLLICAVSVMFFTVFFLQCSLASGKSRRNRKAPVVHKLSGSPVVDSLGGRRFFVHLEEQMAEFISVHGRTAAGLLLIVAALPLVCTLRALPLHRTEPQASAADQQIPPAVAKQLEAMQKRIDQLEQELNARRRKESASDLEGHRARSLDRATRLLPPARPESALAQQAAPANEKPAPFSFADFTWLNGNQPHQRSSVRHQVLYTRDPRRRELHLRLPPSQG